MSSSCFNHFLLIMMFFIILVVVFPNVVLANGGSWQLLINNSGIAAMHMQLLHNDRVIMYDRTSFGPSNMTLSRSAPCIMDQGIKDCTAHSVEYNSLNNTIRPLSLSTDTWCSSGTVFADGRLVQTGGWHEGDKVVRTFNPDCNSTECGWEEDTKGLIQRRWYSTNHDLPDGQSTIVIGGDKVFSYEFYPKTPSSKATEFPFLRETFKDPGEQNNLYPFVFLHPDGNLFIFSNNRSILFNYTTNVVVRTYPDIPEGDPRVYPSTGSAALLPLKNLELGDKVEMEVLVCGGAGPGGYQKARTGVFVPALNTCGRMKITDQNATWVMETMPMPRVMGDMVTLPNGDVIIINGAGSGAAGWERAKDPVLSPVIYHPDNVNGSRFEVMKSTTIPRMYHSSAILLRDGRILVGGSNPHQFNTFSGTLFPTELRLEAFLPPYLNPSLSGIRPYIVHPSSTSTTNIKYGEIFRLIFRIESFVKNGSVKVTMLRPPFNTHSFSMSQRLLVLTNTSIVAPWSNHTFQLWVKAPGSAIIAPPGYYMLFVVQENVPSEGIWVKIDQ